jgi:hypothetical protein
MLDEFLNTVYTHETRKKAEYDMVGLLKDIPTLELRKLASGTPIAELYEKRAMMDECKSLDAQPKTFLDKFKDTPLFEEALALEQEMLQAEAADIEARMQRRGEDQLYQVQDQIRLKKRLLELKLVKLQAGGGEEPGAPPAAPPGEPAQGAGAPGPVPAEGVQDNSQGLGGGAAKMASKRELVQFSDSFARALARGDFEKAARVQTLTKVGEAAAATLSKTALDMAALGGMASKALGAAKPLASKALGMAAAHHELAGAVVGAGAGALAGGPDHRLSGALGGAALGAGTGHVAGGGGGRIGQQIRGAFRPDVAGAAAKGEIAGAKSTVQGVTRVGSLQKAPSAAVADPSVLGPTRGARPGGALAPANPADFGGVAAPPALGLADRMASKLHSMVGAGPSTAETLAHLPTTKPTAIPGRFNRNVQQMPAMNPTGRSVQVPNAIQA